MVSEIASRSIVDALAVLGLAWAILAFATVIACIVMGVRAWWADRSAESGIVLEFRRDGLL
ncbi:MAG: hypothetical protein ACRD4E_10765, partial [Bryobacteraceae bacterium]